MARTTAYIQGIMRAVRTAIISAVALVGAACNTDTPVGTEAASDPSTPGRYGLVVLNHEFGEPGVAVSAQLMAWHGTTRAEVLQALALPDQGWLTSEHPADGRCVVVVDGADPATTEAEPPRVDLLSVGTLSVFPPEPLHTALDLAPRDFPLVLFSLSGVVYDADAPQRLPYLAGGRYRVEAPGDELGAVSGSVEAPEAVWIVDAGLHDGGLRVRWGGGGVATVLLSRDVGSNTVGIVCGDADGELVVPAADLARLGDGDAQLTVARVQLGPLEVEGIDEAEVAFVTRDTTELSLAGLSANP